MIRYRHREHIQPQAVRDVYPQAALALGLIYQDVFGF
jgi:hypothetical protein